MPAGRFIQTAEQFGMVQELDRWVVGEAVSLLHDFHQRGNGENRPRPEFGLHITSPAARSPTPACSSTSSAPSTPRRIPGRITFEITETAAIRNFETAAAFADG